MDVLICDNCKAVKGLSETETDISGTCGNNLIWTLSENNSILTISGTGEMDGYYEGNWSPWHQYREDIQEIVIENGVTVVGSYAFYGCNKAV